MREPLGPPSAKQLAALRTIGTDWATTDLDLPTLNALMVRSLILYRWSDPLAARLTDSGEAIAKADGREP